jgi:tetratricopeptide (TPR) repeat protein
VNLFHRSASMRMEVPSLNNFRVLLSVAALTAVFAIGAPKSEARPPFAAKEGKPCAYCHVNPAGGGARNYRGNYYGAHDHTFAEFDDATEAKKAGEAVGPDPDPSVKPKSWTAPPAAAAAPAKAETKAISTKEATAQAAAAAAAYKKNMKDPAAKKAYAAALATQAHATMLDQSITPHKRYPDALKLDNQALKLDPTNKQAAEDKKAIEDAYKSLGKPIPKV